MRSTEISSLISRPVNLNRAIYPNNHHHHHRSIKMCNRKCFTAVITITACLNADKSPPQNVDSKRVIEDEAKVIVSTYARTPVILSKGKGCKLYDRTAQTSNITVLDGEENLFVKTKKVKKVEGEAYVNIRKGKIIPGYEISVSVPWQGEAKDDEGNTVMKVDGVVEMPYIADENAGEDPKIRVVVKDEGPVGMTLKAAILAKGKDVILEKVRVYVENMANGGPCKDDLKVVPKKDSVVKKVDVVAAGAPAPAVVEKKVEWSGI